MEWQRWHENRVNKSKKQLKQDVDRIRREIPRPSVERNKRIDEALSRHNKVVNRQVAKSQKKINQDGCAVAALGGLAAVALRLALAWNGIV